MKFWFKKFSRQHATEIIPVSKKPHKISYTELAHMPILCFQYKITAKSISFSFDSIIVVISQPVQKWEKQMFSDTYISTLESGFK